MSTSNADPKEGPKRGFLDEDGVDQVHDKLVKLRELERLRDNLTRMLVHDMRSSLLCITGSLELIRQEWEANGKLSVDLWQMSVVAAQDAIGMCTSLLDVSRMEDGQMPIRRESCNLLTSISQAVAETQMHVDFQGLTVRVEGEATLIFSDKSLLHRILVNLLAHAIKYTPRGGGIVLRTAVLGNDVRVEVQDASRGIPREFHEKLFEKFGQVESQESQSYASGLGLTFCKLVVEAQGGRIGVDSEPGKGSTFWFTLPATECGRVMPYSQ
jgi:two-component system, sensor histidine kinase and response regulator